MGIKKSSAELKRDLKLVATDLERTAGEISKLAERIKDVDVVAVLHLMNRVCRDSDKLKAYGDKVKDGRIGRGKPD